ncbi:hypothetical protein QJS04_geneDACA009174 [Acorus gramineus]|uniref:Uncharacterized protein n=1 Tax=Acorus gramineus TaxID=55184 RepID=A0AAV9AU95_ACOGR|nr:hypothetical protein QJS04_geneDACA009174 [Acorus gramineus]
MTDVFHGLMKLFQISTRPFPPKYHGITKATGNSGSTKMTIWLVPSLSPSSDRITSLKPFIFAMT